MIMTENKHIGKIIYILVALALAAVMTVSGSAYSNATKAVISLVKLAGAQGVSPCLLYSSWSAVTS